MKIVFGTDGSEHSKFAEDFLLRYPAQGAKIFCCAVYSTSHVVMATSHPFLGPILADQITLAVESAKDEAVRTAKESAERLKKAGFDAEAVVLEGDISTALCKFSASEKANFAVVGSRGEGTLEALFLGSVARGLVNDTDINVLVCRKREFGAPEGIEAVFATDYSEFAERVAEKLPTLVNGKFKSLEVISVMDPQSKELLELSGALNEPAGPQGFADLEKGLEDWLHKKTDALAQKLAPLAENTSSTVLYGDARKELLERAEQTHKDLIIIGARGRSGLSRLLLGSVSHYIVSRATCSVFIVRA